MGILSELTPAIFKVEDIELKARILSISEILEVITDHLARTSDLEGKELAREAERVHKAFDYTDPMASDLLLKGLKDHTEGFDVDDAGILLAAKYKEAAYAVFKYILYGWHDDDHPEQEAENGSKKEAQA